MNKRVLSGASKVPREPRQARSQASTERLLDAALEVIAKDGLGGLSVAEVSRRSGVANGSLYHRFGDRAGLLAAAQERFGRLVKGEWATMSAAMEQSDDATSFLTRLVEPFLRLFSEHRALFSAFFISGHDDVGVKARGAQIGQFAASEIGGTLARRFGCPADAAAAAYELLFGQAVLLVLAGGEEAPLTREARVRHLVRALLAVVRGGSEGTGPSLHQ